MFMRRLFRRSRGSLAGAVGRLRARSSRPEYVICDDISNGRERDKLPAYSYDRNEQPPLDFHYVTEYIQSEPVGLDLSLNGMRACDCQDDCAAGACNCSATRQSGPTYYDASGRLSAEYRFDAPEVIRECNAACKCNRSSCRNMVIQAGCRLRLLLFKTRLRGWGVRTRDHLKRGTFVGAYCGELISVADSYKRQDDTYLFNLSSSRSPADRPKCERPEHDQIEVDASTASELCAGYEASPAGQHQHQAQPDAQYAAWPDLPEAASEPLEGSSEAEPEPGPACEQSASDNQFVCDAKFYGNFTRFINHSCEPNVTGIRSFTSHQDSRFPYIAFFVNQDVPANSELTLSYGDNYWLVKCKRDKVFCLCKKPSCRFTKKTFPQTSKLYEQQQQQQQQ